MFVYFNVILNEINLKIDILGVDKMGVQVNNSGLNSHLMANAAASSPVQSAMVDGRVAASEQDICARIKAAAKAIDPGFIRKCSIVRDEAIIRQGKSMNADVVIEAIGNVQFRPERLSREEMDEFDKTQAAKLSKMVRSIFDQSTVVGDQQSETAYTFLTNLVSKTEEPKRPRYFIEKESNSYKILSDLVTDYNRMIGSRQWFGETSPASSYRVKNEPRLENPAPGYFEGVLTGAVLTSAAFIAASVFFRV